MVRIVTIVEERECTLPVVLFKVHDRQELNAARALNEFPNNSIRHELYRIESITQNSVEFEQTIKIFESNSQVCFACIGTNKLNYVYYHTSTKQIYMFLLSLL